MLTNLEEGQKYIQNQLGMSLEAPTRKHPRVAVSTANIQHDEVMPLFIAEDSNSTKIREKLKILFGTGFAFQSYFFYSESIRR